MSNCFSRDELYFRHQLSHQQIDDFLQEQKCILCPETKAASLQKLNEFLQLTSLFDRWGTSFICLKGPILSLKIYGDPAYRTIGDFDFLMTFPEVERTIPLLLSQGYRFSEEDFSQEKLRKLKKYRNQVLLIHPETGALVELHWRLLQIPPVNEELVDRLVQDNLKEVTYSGLKFLSLSDELELLFLIIHGGQHNWFRLKWLEDVHQLALQNRYDPEKFRKLVKKLHARRMVNLCNTLLQYIYPDEPALPSSGKSLKFAVKFAKSRICSDAERQFEKIPELVRYSVCLLTNFPGIRYKLRVIRFVFYSLFEKNIEKDPSFSFLSLVNRPLSHLRNRYRLTKLTE